MLPRNARYFERLSVTSSKLSSTVTTNKETTETPPLKQAHELPGPGALAGIRFVGRLVSSAEARSNLHLLQMDLVRQYGPVLKLTWPHGSSPCVACPKLMEDIVRHQDPVPVRGEIKAWDLYLDSENKPRALLTSTGTDWERRRASVRGLMLKTDAMKSALAAMSSVSDDLCKVIEERKDGQDYVPDAVQVIYRWAFEGIVNVLFGTRAGCLELGGEGVNKRSDAFLNGLNVIMDATFNSLVLLAPMHRRLNTRMWQQHKSAWETVSDSVNYHTEEMINTLDKISPDSTPLMISLLGNIHLSNEDIQSMAMELLFGGVDTTSNTMTFLLYNLASNPEKQEKLREEIRSVIGKEELTLSHIQKMTYLRNCIKESLRMYPILFIYGRMLQSDFVSKSRGVHLKKGSPVLFFNYALGRLESLWDKPDEFIPERFERKPGETDRSHLFSVPFGFGTRGCIGKRVAEAELSSLTTKVLQSYRLSVDGRYALTPVTRGSLTAGKYLPVRFHKLC